MPLLDAAGGGSDNGTFDHGRSTIAIRDRGRRSMQRGRLAWLFVAVFCIASITRGGGWTTGSTWPTATAGGESGRPGPGRPATSAGATPPTDSAGRPAGPLDLGRRRDDLPRRPVRAPLHREPLCGGLGVTMGGNAEFLVWFYKGPGDHVIWGVDVPKAGTYEVWIEWAQIDEHADNPITRQVAGRHGALSQRMVLPVKLGPMRNFHRY